MSDEILPRALEPGRTSAGCVDNDEALTHPSGCARPGTAASKSRPSGNGPAGAWLVREQPRRPSRIWRSADGGQRSSQVAASTALAWGCSYASRHVAWSAVTASTTSRCCDQHGYRARSASGIADDEHVPHPLGERRPRGQRGFGLKR